MVTIVTKIIAPLVGALNKLYSSNLKVLIIQIKNKIMAKVEKIKVARPPQLIKVITGPLSNDLKTKVATAFEAVVSAIKVKHLG